jgi:recombination protein RecA
VTVDDDRKRRLEKTVTDLQNRFGLRAINRSPRAAALPVVPTGFRALDAALGIGGLPRGRLSEVVGIPTAGAATLALKTIAQAQTQNGTAVYIDTAQTFDPDYAHRCGVDLHRLMLVHPYNIQQAIAMLPDFAGNGGFDLLVFDMPLHPPLQPERQQQLSSALGRLIAPLHRSDCVLLFLTSLPPGSGQPLTEYPRHMALPHYASLRLLIQRARWLYKRQDVRGYEADVLLLKNKLGSAGQEVRIAITFNGTVQGDGV